MGRCIMVLIAFSFGLDSHAQGTLQSASVAVELSKEDIHITQTFHLDLPDTSRHVHLRSLHFDHLTISDFTCHIDHFNVIKNKIPATTLYNYKINITDNQKMDDLTISYTWHRTEEKAEIPLFFPDIPAASSNDTLFLGQIQMPVDFAFRMDFPKVDYNQLSEDGSRKLSFSLPALPSLLRIQYGDMTNLSSNIGLMADWCIAAVFIIMAIFIWLNRKRLTYG